MSLELLAALIAFAFVSSITPGPNNLMLMASGANFGLKRTLPHLLGVGVGFVVMVLLVGVGLMGIFELYPLTYRVLWVGSVLYLVFLAWKIATAAPLRDSGEAAGSPITFVQAALFQWMNPKAWAMALAAISLYAPSRTVDAVVLVALVFGLVNLPSVFSWAVLGQQMSRLLKTANHARAFNVVMAVLLLATVLPMLGA